MEQSRSPPTHEWPRGRVRPSLWVNAGTVRTNHLLPGANVEWLRVLSKSVQMPFEEQGLRREGWHALSMDSHAKHYPTTLRFGPRVVVLYPRGHGAQNGENNFSKATQLGSSRSSQALSAPIPMPPQSLDI